MAISFDQLWVMETSMPCWFGMDKKFNSIPWFPEAPLSPSPLFNNAQSLIHLDLEHHLNLPSILAAWEWGFPFIRRLSKLTFWIGWLACGLKLKFNYVPLPCGLQPHHITFVLRILAPLDNGYKNPLSYIIVKCKHEKGIRVLHILKWGSDRVKLLMLV